MMSKEEIMRKLKTRDHIYGYFYGRPCHKYEGMYFQAPLLKIDIHELRLNEDETALIWENIDTYKLNTPVFNFTDYGITWAFTKEEIEPPTLEEMVWFSLDLEFVKLLRGNQ